MTPPPGLVSMLCQERMWAEGTETALRIVTALPAGSEFTLQKTHKSICAKRNASARTMLEEGLEWLLFVDSDIVTCGDAIPALLRHEPADIVGGIYPKREPGGGVVGGVVVERPEVEDPLRPSDHPDFAFNPLNPRRCGDDVGAVEVDVLGMGLTLIRRPVLEELEFPWFVSNRRKDNTAEDINFCLRARDAGFKIVAETRLQAGHIGTHTYTVCEAAEYMEREGP